MLTAALVAVRRGWPVFPLRRYSKTPALTGWAHRASTDVDQVRTWWTDQPDSNVGIACGPAELVVLDLDNAHGHAPPARWARRGVTHGREVFAVLAADAGQPVPDTFTVATPAGGLHLYFAAPAGLELRNTVGRLGWRIDTRAAGGYVVGPGSALHVAGHIRRYRILREAPVAALPDWIATALTAASIPRVLAGHLSASLPPAARVSPYVLAAVTGETQAVAHAVPGTRNHTLFRAAANLGELLGAGVLDEPTARDALLTAAQIHCGIDGFTAAEARRTIDNGLTRGRRNPRTIES
jgi:hypothetical protein